MNPPVFPSIPPKKPLRLALPPALAAGLAACLALAGCQGRPAAVGDDFTLFSAKVAPSPHTRPPEVYPTALAIQVSLEPPPILKAQGLTLSELVFVKLKEGEEKGAADQPWSARRLLFSSQIVGDRAYLLAPQPGLYAAVGLRARKGVMEGVRWPEKEGRPQGGKPLAGGQLLGHTLYVVYFPDELVRRSVTQVEPGRLAFLGRYRLGLASLASTAKAKPPFAFDRFPHRGPMPQPSQTPHLFMGLLLDSAKQGEAQAQMEGLARRDLGAAFPAAAPALAP